MAYGQQQNVWGARSNAYGDEEKDKPFGAGMGGNSIQAQGTGAQTLAGVGAGQQQQAQNQADAPYKGLSQYASLFHGVADKSTTTQQSGGK